MNSRRFKSGDILLATHREFRKGVHPIVYLTRHSDKSFIGAMLTHHSDTRRNLKMDMSYFDNKTDYENTYLVLAKFIKPEEWGPIKKINELTKDGLSFVIEILADKPEETFANYFRRYATT